MTGRGRPRIGPAIKIRFWPEQDRIIDAYRDRFGVTRAEAIRDLVGAGIKYLGLKDPDTQD